MSYGNKATRAQAMLDELLHAPNQTITVHDNPLWTPSGNAPHSELLRILAQGGAIQTIAKTGRFGGSTHTLTGHGQWLLEQLKANRLNDPDYWHDAQVVKWNLLLPASDAVGKGPAVHMLNECERYAISAAWRGSQDHASVIEQYGTVEAKAILEFAQDIQGAADITFAGVNSDDAIATIRQSLSEDTKLSINALNRIAIVLMYKMLHRQEVY